MYILYDEGECIGLCTSYSTLTRYSYAMRDVHSVRVHIICAHGLDKLSQISTVMPGIRAMDMGSLTPMLSSSLVSRLC